MIGRIAPLFFSCLFFTHSWCLPNDSSTVSSKRLAFTVSTLAGVQAISTIGLSNVWYNQFEQEPFHFFNDGAEWLQMDKAGHAYSGYLLSAVTEPLYRWTGLTQNKVRLFSGLTAWSYLLSVELLDARSTAWGFSWQDVAANTAGVGFYWLKSSKYGNGLDMKFSFSRSPYAALRPSHLGTGFTQELLKDYNGQTYWLSYAPLHKTDLPWYWKMWQVSAGYSAHEMLHAREPEYTVNGQSYTAQRELIGSLDINWKAIPVKNEIARTLIHSLRYIKLPFPALIIRNGQLNGSWLYF